MAISDGARRNHDELFPQGASTLAQTDPELIEYFDNFAFDDVIADSDLDPPTRLMVQLAALIATQSISEFRVMAGAALTVGVTAVQVKEIVYQTVPYVGMAKVFDLPPADEQHIQRYLSAHGYSACSPCSSRSSDTPAPSTLLKRSTTSPATRRRRSPRTSRITP